jgi:hypothetical protein
LFCCVLLPLFVFFLFSISRRRLHHLQLLLRAHHPCLFVERESRIFNSLGSDLVWFGFLSPQSVANFVFAGDGCRFWRTRTRTPSLYMLPPVCDL